MEARKTIKTIQFTIPILTVLLIILSGCSGGFFKGGSGQMETYKFRSGTEGLKMEFIEGMPPNQLFIGTEFSTGIRIKNMGAYDVSQDARLEVSVPDRTAFLFQQPNTNPISLRGKSLYIKDGEEDIRMFPMKALCFPGYTGTRDSIVRNYTRKLKATACYYYETVADVDLCIDTRKFLRQKNEKAECDMKSVSLSGGQGGPVGLATISPTVIPKSGDETTIQLSLSIDKLQGIDHTIFSANNRGCEIIPESNQQNVVSVEVTMGGQVLECEPFEVKLKEKNAVSTLCKTTVSANQGAYITPITVTMKYYVQQNILRSITVEPPPGEEGVNCDLIASSNAVR